MPSQFALYLVVGGLSFVADMIVFLSILSYGYVLAVAVGFSVGTFCNYLLSRLIAFRGGRFRVGVELLMLFVVALIGAGLTISLALLLTDLGVGAVAAKIVATVIVLAWNYLGRRLLVFHPEIPYGVVRVLNRATSRSPKRQERSKGNKDD